MSDEARLMTSDEVARAIGVTRQTVARWTRSGVLVPEIFTAGGHARFVLDDVKDQLRAHHQRQRDQR